MKSKTHRITILVTAVGILSALGGLASNGPDSAAVSGVVTSKEEGRMEGVLISAKSEGGTIAVTVISDSQGRYAFPSGRLKAGNYHIKIRAVGYELDDAGLVRVDADKTIQLNLTLRKTIDLASQLTDAEWLMSIPGNAEQKLFRTTCVECHSMQRIFQSKYDATGFLPVLQRMGFNIAVAGPEEQGSSSAPTGERFDPFRDTRPPAEELAKYLSSVNLSSSKDGKWSYEFKTFPRPTGRAARAIITEYDLPRQECQPHDVVVDRDGMVWYGDFGNNLNASLGRLNPQTGEVKEWQVPLLKPKASKSMLDLRLDKDGNLWMAMRMQGGIAKFDKKAEKFTTWAAPQKYNFDRMNVSMIALNPDGTVWFKDSPNLKAHRLDPKTGEIATFSMPNVFYGIESDSKGNLYMASLNSHKIGVMDAKTGKWEIYTPSTPRAAPRRGDMDRLDRFWFGEFLARTTGVRL